MSDEQAPPSKMPRSPKEQGRLAQGCLALFGLPFAGFGVFAIIQAFREVNKGKGKEAAMLGLFGLVFTGGGGALMIGSLFGGRKVRQRAEKELAHPNEPWLWCEDWARGDATSAGRQGLAVFWVFALFWNGVSSFVWFVIPQEIAKGNKVALIAFLFPLIGLGLIVGAIRSTLAWQRYGQTRFKLTTVPASPGGVLQGNIEVNTRLQPEIGVVLHLRCIRRSTTRSGKNTRTDETTIWEDEKILGPKLPEHRAGKTKIPVFFRIPTGALESDTDYQPSNGVVWRLRASASVPGVDFDEDYQVPVFKNGAATAEEIPDPTIQYQLPVEKLRAARHSRIRVTDLPGGGREFVFPAARNPGVALGITLFAALFSGIAIALAFFKGMIFFPVLFGIVGLLISWWAAELWLRSSRVMVGRGGVEVRHRWLFISRAKSVAALDVRELTFRTGMTSGNKNFYDIQLIQNDGRKITLATVIPSKVELDWLIREMEEALLK